MDPQNSGKVAKTHKTHKNTKNTRNLVEILSKYTCLYNIFETYFSYWGYLFAINLQNYLRTSSLKRANNIPKLTGVHYICCKKLGTSHDVKGLAIGSFLERIVVERANDDLC